MAKMIKLGLLTIEDMENAGCNNGNYPVWHAQTEDGSEIGGVTCRCGSGCSGTDRIISVNGEDFLVIEEEEDDI